MIYGRKEERTLAAADQDERCRLFAPCKVVKGWSTTAPGGRLGARAANAAQSSPSARRRARTCGNQARRQDDTRALLLYLKEALHVVPAASLPHGLVRGLPRVLVGGWLWRPAADGRAHGISTHNASSSLTASGEPANDRTTTSAAPRTSSAHMRLRMAARARVCREQRERGRWGAELAGQATPGWGRARAT